MTSLLLVTTVQWYSWPVLSNGQRKSKVNGTIVLSRANGFTVVAEAGNFCLLKKKRKSKKKKRYYGVKCNSVEMPRLLFSEEAV